MKALIFGDSQSGATGREVERLLKQRGAFVKRVTKSGRSTKKLVGIAKSHLEPNWDEVYLFAGGNDGSVQEADLRALLSFFSTAGRVVYAGPPPATLITDLGLAKKVWGSAKSADKFFPKTAAFREAKNEAYKKVAADFSNVEVKDFREAPVSGAVTQPSGVSYPSQTDGIHTRGSTSKEVAAYLVQPGGISKAGIGKALALGIAAAVAYNRWGR